MNITTFRLAIKSTRYRKTALILSIISIAFSVVLLLGIERIRRSIETSFTNTISGTDLIVGARTGNLSLLLSTVFHRGNNTKGISWTSYETIASNPQVDWTIPIVLGDSHKGFAVVGTNSDFFKHYRYGPNLPLETKNGQLVLANMTTVIGAKVAEALAYNVDDAIVLTHGMGTEDFSNHKDNPFTVSAILKPTGTPIDNSVLVLMNDLDHIHNEFYNQDIDPFAAMESADDHHGHNHDAHGSHPKTLTGFFVGVKNKSNILQLQKAINDSTSEALMAIMPVITLLELWSVINPIENILKLISFVVLFISLGSMLTTLLTSLNQRRREMSILRSLGARPQLIFGLIILESVGIVLSGILLGICLLIVALIISQPLFSQNFGIRVDLWVANLNEIYILLAILISGLLIGLFPAVQCYKQALGDGLTIKH
jgi:putative ABC transport system permease protein